MKMLIVEDQKLMRQLLREFLQTVYPASRIMESGDAASALALCLEHRPQLVLMDVSLPDGNGIELTATVKAALPDTEIIVVSQFSAQTYIDRALAAGAATYVTKDQMYRNLLPAIAAALGSSRTRRAADA